jgi:hypothetical protein
MSTRLKLLLVLSIASGAALLGLHRAGLVRPRSSTLDETALRATPFAEAQAVFRSVRTAPVQDLHSAADFAELLGRATVERSRVGPGPDDVPALLRHTAELMFHRFIDPEVSAYRSWRESLGYRLADAETMRREGVPVHYELFIGRPYPGDAEFDAVHDQMWTQSLDNRGRSHRVRAFATEPKGVAVNFGRITTRSPLSWPAAAGLLPSEVWHGASGGGHRDWWAPPGGRAAEHLRRHGSLNVASVAVIAEFERGDRYPIRLLYFQDPRTGRWWLEALQLLNAPYERFPMLEF